MKVYIKNKMISLGGSSEVLNEKMEPIFKVEGNVVTFTRKKKMYDMDYKLLYTIQNRYWNFFSHKVFVKDAEGKKIATIKKNKWSFNQKFEILDTEIPMSIDGKFFSATSHIMKDGQPSATIVREFTLINDAFTLEANEEDIPFYTALVIALDNLNDERTERR